jgi:hypothetical protein
MRQNRPMILTGLAAMLVMATLAFAMSTPASATGIAQRVTATPAPYPPPGPTPPGGGGGGGMAPVPIEDTRLVGRVPSADVAAALANPNAIAGWMVPRNPNLGHHPYFNPYRTCLTVRNIGVPYHPAYNPLVFKAGCP